MKKKKKKHVVRIVDTHSVDYTFLDKTPRLIINKSEQESNKKQQDIRKHIKDLKIKKYHKTNLNVKSRRNHSPVYE